MRRYFVTIVLLLACTNPTQAQGLLTRLAQIRTDKFPEIGVVLTVYSAKGKPVSGLTRDDFTLAEDGKNVSVVSVELEKTPLSVALVLDESGSMGPTMPDLKAAAGDFLRSLEPSEDRALLISFSDRPTLAVPLTVDRRRTLDAVQGLKAGGATALYDAVKMAVDELASVSGRRMVVLFTDGRDQNAAGTGPQSAYSPVGVAKLARDAQVMLWTIGLGTDVDAKLLSRLAEVTGGRFYRPKQAGDLRKAFARVLMDVRTQYDVRYRTPADKRDGTDRLVTVTSSQKGATGQGRSRYLAPTERPASAPPPAGGLVANGQAKTTVVTTVQAGQIKFLGMPEHSIVTAWPAAYEAWIDAPASTQLCGWASEGLYAPPGKWRVDIAGYGKFEVEVKSDQIAVIKDPKYTGPLTPQPSESPAAPAAPDQSPAPESPSAPEPQESSPAEDPVQ